MNDFTRNEFLVLIFQERQPEKIAAADLPGITPPKNYDAAAAENQERKTRQFDGEKISDIFLYIRNGKTRQKRTRKIFGQTLYD